MKRNILKNFWKSMINDELRKIIEPYYPTLQELMCKLAERTTKDSTFTIDTVAGKITFSL